MEDQPFALNRRNFLSTLTGSLAVGFFLPAGGRMLQAAPSTPQETPLNAYVRIQTDGTITLVFGGCEMGQGSLSGLSQILAEELKVDWGQIEVEQSLVDPQVTYITGGSSAVRGRFGPLRTAGATARELLIAGAMLQVGDTTRANFNADKATVIYTNPATQAQTILAYKDLVGQAITPAAAQLLPSPIPLTPPSQFRLIGQRLPRLDIPLKTNGSADYGIDVFLPGMVFAAIKHCPTIGGVLASTPAKPSGAIAVVPCKASDTRGSVTAGSYNAVAVVADNTWKAKNLARSLKVAWTLPASLTNVDSASLLAQAQQLLANGQPIIAEPSNPTPAVSLIESQVAAALAGAAKTAGATFTLPYLAHGTMEVLNCSVRIAFSGATPVSCEVWAPNQAANWVAGTAAALIGIPASQITVYTTFLGGGLGRKIEQDYISQAIQVALAVKAPVKLTWMREEDFGHDQCRPMAVVQTNAGLDANNNIIAWYYRNVSQAILGQRGWIKPGTLDSQAIEGATALPYNRGLFVTEWVPLPAGIPVGFWRSVGNSINAFAVESTIDMLALAAKMDPFAFRYQILTDPRALAVLQAADQMSAWRKSLPAGHAWGMALVESFQTVVCEVFEISQPVAGTLKVHRVACAVDCGIAVNPDSVEAQMEGGITHGLSAALWGQLTFTNGIANQTNFNKYRTLRLGEMPVITVQILPSQNSPSGTGEPGVPPVAPALANAWFRLTGTRVTSLPFFPGATMSGL